MSYSALEAVNIMLRATQTSPAQSENESRREYALAITSLNQERRRILVYGYRFNTDTIDLSYDSTAGKIPLSPTYLDVRLPAPYVIRDDAVWDPNNNRFHNENLTGVEVVVDVGFTDMPLAIQNWVVYSAARRFYQSLNDEDSFYLIQLEKQAWAQAMATEDPSITESAGIRRLNTSFSRTV